MLVKSFLIAILAASFAPAIGVGLFIALHVG